MATGFDVQVTRGEVNVGTITGTVTVAGTVVVSSVTAPITVTGTVDVGTITNPVTVTGTVDVGTVATVTTITNPVTVTGLVNVGTLATITNPVTVTGTVDVGTVTTVSAVTDITNAVTVTGSVDVGTVTSITGGDIDAQLVDAAGNRAKIDTTVSAIRTITVEHAEIHAGDEYSSSYLWTTVASAANADMLLQVGAGKEGHLIIDVAVGGNCYFYLYEGTTFDNAGTALGEFNRCRSSGNTATITATHTPTVTGVGTAIETAYIPGGAGTDPSGKTAAPGGSGGARHEWVLDKSTNYLIRLTNVSGAARAMSIDASWYEE